MEMVLQQRYIPPPGFKFQPTNKELIKDYLMPMVLNQLNVESVGWYIFNQDIYKYDNPSLLLQEVGQSDHEAGAYFYTPRRKISKTGKNVKRNTGEGTWKAQTKPTSIENNSGNQIGSDTMFAFEWKDKEAKKTSNDLKREKGSWTMHEYALLPEFYRVNQIDPEYVISKIYCSKPGEAVPDQQQSQICQLPAAAKRQRITSSMGTVPAESPINNNGASTSWASRFIGTEVSPLSSFGKSSAWAPSCVPPVSTTPPSDVTNFEDPLNFMFSLDDLELEDPMNISSNDWFLATEDNLNTTAPDTNYNTNSVVDVEDTSSLVVQDVVIPTEEQHDLTGLSNGFLGRHQEKKKELLMTGDDFKAWRG